MNRFSSAITVAAALSAFTGCVSKNDGNPSEKRDPASLSKKKIDPSGYAYDPLDTSCGGFPRLSVRTLPGTCLGLVLGQDRAIDKVTKKAVTMPRTLLEVAPNEFLLANMGVWDAAKKAGSVSLLRRGTDGFELQILKTGLDHPHGLVKGPDGLIYLGESRQISRFKYEGGQITSFTKIASLPKLKKHLHSLTELTFDPRSGDLFANLGSGSDHCEAAGKTKMSECSEVDKSGVAAIYRFPASQLQSRAKTGDATGEHAAKGLRNSMAMVVSDAGYLIQGENGRDFREREEPYEEINVIEPGARVANYGWPQCFNFHAFSPEFQFTDVKRKGFRAVFPNVNCAVSQPNAQTNYQPPYVLMPPHTAPLHANYFKNPRGLGSILNGRLIMSWHGWQVTGHRLVAYETDSQGRPLTTSPGDQPTYQSDRGGGRCPEKKPFAPRGGMDRYSAYTELISGWDKVEKVRPKGAPTGFAVADDGSIWIAEDKNRTIVRLATSSANTQDPCGAEAPPAEPEDDPRIRWLAWRSAVAGDPKSLALYQDLTKKLTTPLCSECHGFKKTEIADDLFSSLDFMVADDFVSAGDPAKSKLYGAISGAPELPPMPPASARVPMPKGSQGARLVALVKAWIEGLPQDIDQSYVKIQIGSARDIFAKPNVKGEACGQIKAGDFIYVDGREKTRPVSDGWQWTKLYVLPGSSNIDPARCGYPQDGVFYIQLKKSAR